MKSIGFRLFIKIIVLDFSLQDRNDFFLHFGKGQETKNCPNLHHVNLRFSCRSSLGSYLTKNNQSCQQPMCNILDYILYINNDMKI